LILGAVMRKYCAGQYLWGEPVWDERYNEC